MPNNVIVFEQHWQDYGPLALTRPVYGLRIGTSTLAEKLAESYPDAAIHFRARNHIAPTIDQIVYFKQIFSRGGVTVNNDAILQQGGLFIDGAVIAVLSEMPAAQGPDEIGVVQQSFIENGKTIERERVVYARLSTAGVMAAGSPQTLLNTPRDTGLPVKDVTGQIKIAGFPWELVINNAPAIEAEYKTRKKGGSAPDGVIVLGKAECWFSPKCSVSPGVVIDLRGGHGVYVGDGVEIQGNVTIDARTGPVILEDCTGSRTVVESQSLIQGPVYIGPVNLIKQATVREGCSFGPVCRVGGEIEETIIVGYSNKQHYGYMGHCVIGEWVNWGAGTTNSNLKNDYSSVVVELSHGRRIDSGQNKTVGCYIGDHTKTALSTMLNTGTVIGVMSNILMNTVTEDKYLPSYCIYDNGRILLNRSGVKTAEIVMSRRNMPMTAEYKQLYEHISAELRDETREMAKASKEKRQ